MHWYQLAEEIHGVLGDLDRVIAGLQYGDGAARPIVIRPYWIWRVPGLPSRLWPMRGSGQCCPSTVEEERSYSTRAVLEVAPSQRVLDLRLALDHPVHASVDLVVAGVLDPQQRGQRRL